MSYFKHSVEVVLPCELTEMKHLPKATGSVLTELCTTFNDANLMSQDKSLSY